MESSNMNSRSSIQWLCGILVLAFIHGISCDPNSGCLKNGNTVLNIEQCIGENGLEFVPLNINGFLGKFTFMKEHQICNTVTREFSIQFGQGCTIDFDVLFVVKNQTVVKLSNGGYEELKLLLEKDGLKNEEKDGNTKIVARCTPKIEDDSKSLKLMITDGEGDKSIKGCGLYLKFDHALVRYTTTSSTTTTTAITTTTPPTPGLSTSHPTAPISSPASFFARHWIWLLIVSIVIILLLVVSFIGLIVWAKRRNANRKAPVEEGKMGKDINMMTARTAKEVDDVPWNGQKPTPANYYPEPPSNLRSQDVGKEYENLQQLKEGGPPAFAEDNATEVQKGNPDAGGQYENLQELIESTRLQTF